MPGRARSEIREKQITARDISLVALFVAFLTVCSFVAVPLGAVPVTLQSVGVIVSSGVLGAKKGTLVTVIYLTLGAVGLPVFSGFTGGYGVLLGPTGGFLIGFVPMSIVVGLLSGKMNRSFNWVLLSAAIGNIVLYAVGVFFYANVHLNGSSESYYSAFLTGVVPFLVPDIIKIVFSALLVVRIKKIV